MLILFSIFLLALAFRIFGINFEIPHPDDHYVVQGAMYFGPAKVQPVGYGLVNKHVWPGTTLVFLLTLLFSLYFWIGKISGDFSSADGTMRT